MIIWLNGAFGSGKTTCAKALHNLIKESFIYDAENVGFLIRQNLLKALHVDNFQDQVLGERLIINYSRTYILDIMAL